MASEVMLAPTPAPATSIREMDDVRDMVRSATVTTIYVSRSEVMHECDTLCLAIGTRNINSISPDLYHPHKACFLANRMNTRIHCKSYTVKST